MADISELKDIGAELQTDLKDNIDNMYSDVYLEDVMGNLSLTLSNGSLQTGHIGGDNPAAKIKIDAVRGSLTIKHN